MKKIPTLFNTRLNTLLCASLLFVSKAIAADLSLSQPSISPQGNIKALAHGAQGATAVVEVSPNLVDWAYGSTVTLTNGDATFFIQPPANGLFCRLRPADTAEIPHPFSFSFTPNSDFIRSALAYGDGIALHSQDDNDFIYDFNLTADSTFSAATMTMEVVNTTHGLPAGLTYLGGVTLDPSGMIFFGNATLAITVPAGLDLTHAGVIAWDSGGTEVHFVPFTRSGNQVTVAVHRLTGFGLVVSNGGDVKALTDSVPTDPLAQTDHLVAVSQLNLKTTGALRAFSAPDRFTCPFADFWRDFFLRRAAELRAAIADDSLLEQTLYYYNGTASVASHMSDPCFSEALAAIDLCDSTAMQAILASVDNAANRCRHDRDLRALVRLWRSALLSSRGSWTRQRSLAQYQHILDTLHECLEFKIEILSSTSVSSTTGIVRTSVSSELQAKWTPAPAPENHSFRIAGDADFTLDSTAWDNPPSPCSVTPAPSNGHAYLKYLRLENLQLDVDRVVIHSDQELSLPRYVLIIDPMVPPPSENYTMNCPPAAPFRVNASNWAVAFGALHKSELTKDGSQSVYLIKNFNHQSNTAPEKKEYYQTGRADSLDVTESTTISISYQGGTP